MNYPDYHGLEGPRTCTDAQMPLCYPSTFIPDGVNITKQMERIAFVINKSSFVTNDTRPAISYENIDDLQLVGLSRENEMKRMQKRHSPATPLINITQLRRSVLLPSYTRSL
jgi:hypothetical protein